jgi:hypothetical protein
MNFGKDPQYKEAAEYLQKHEINEIFQSLTQSILMDSPENPREYLVDHLKMLKSLKVTRS